LRILEIDEELIGNKYKNQKANKGKGDQAIIVKNQAAAANGKSALHDISILGAKKKNYTKETNDNVRSNHDFEDISTRRINIVTNNNNNSSNNNYLSDKFIDNLDGMISTKISNKHLKFI